MARRPRFETLEQRCVLTVFTVTTLSDAVVPGSLRNALNQANALAGADTIQFQPGLSGTYQLGLGTLAISDSVTINGPGAANLTIDAAALARIFQISNEAGDVTIRGLTLTGGRASASNHGGAVLSESLGLLTIAESTLKGNSAVGNGGAVFATGDLALTNVTIGGTGANGPNVATGDGGGVYAFSSVTLTNCTISGNSAGNNGGGVYARGTVVLQDSTIGGAAAGAGNVAANSGGGVFAVTVNAVGSTIARNIATTLQGGGIGARGIVTLQNSVVSGNVAGGDGGGIHASLGVNLTNCTIGGTTAAAGNVAADDGGGIYADSVTLLNCTVAANEAQNGLTGDGGGIFVKATALIKNSTVANNKAGNDGAGVFGAIVTLQNATLATNVADSNGGGVGRGGGVFATGRFTMQNSIAVGNSAPASPELFIPTGNFSSVKWSLIANNSGLPAGAQFTVTGPAGPANGSGNLIGQPGGPSAISVTNVFGAGGGALANNGGPTATIALLTGAIAIDKGKDTLAVSPTTGDQRGLPFERIIGLAVDLGAYENQTANSRPVVANPIVDQIAVVGQPYVFTVPANTFTDANGDPLTYTATLSSGGALPAWLAFNQLARTFVGVPAAADIGSLSIRVTVNDGNGGTASDDFSLTIAAFHPADYDHSGAVGASDYNLWRSTFGSQSSLSADGNQNGTVDAADYVLWRKYKTAAAAGATAPSPGSGPGGLADGSDPSNGAKRLELASNVAPTSERAALLPRRTESLSPTAIGDRVLRRTESLPARRVGARFSGLAHLLLLAEVDWLARHHASVATGDGQAQSVDEALQSWGLSSFAPFARDGGGADPFGEVPAAPLLAITPKSLRRP